MIRLICPDCGGRGRHRSVLGEDGIWCQLCSGARTVTQQQMEWWLRGREYYETRVTNGETLRVCAKRLGISTTELSHMERGRADPERLRMDHDAHA